MASSFALAEAQFTQLAAMGKFSAQDIALRLRLMASTFLGLVTLRVLGDPQLDANWDTIPDMLTSIVFDGLLPPVGGTHERNDER